MKKSHIKDSGQYWQEAEQRLIEFLKKNSDYGITKFKVVSNVQKISIGVDIDYSDSRYLGFKFDITYKISSSEVAATHSKYSEDPAKNREIFNQNAAKIIASAAEATNITLKHVSNKFKIITPDPNITKSTNRPVLLFENGVKKSEIQF